MGDVVMTDFERTRMSDGYAARVRDSTGGMWVWDDRATGQSCEACGERISSGETAYRRPSKPWRSKKDPVIHTKCW